MEPQAIPRHPLPKIRHHPPCMLEKENQHLRRAVADLTVDTLILKEAAKGDF